LLRNVNGKSYILYQTVPFPLTPSDPGISFQHAKGAPEQLFRKTLHLSLTLQHLASVNVLLK